MADPKFPLPFEGNYRLTQGFGERPSVYKSLGLPGHNGIDWSMPVGVPILAVASGKVVLLDNDPEGFGLHVKLEHSWGQSLYAHLSRIDVKMDQQVKAGARLALSGNTGFSSGAHLHFGVRVNPYDTGDGWYGYTNPQRFLNWPEAGAPADANTAELERQLNEARQQVEELQGAFTFERQELRQQADLWREEVTQLLRQYMPGQLPINSDVLATLSALMQSWSQEIEQLRSNQIASLFAPPTEPP